MWLLEVEIDWLVLRTLNVYLDLIVCPAVQPLGLKAGEQVVVLDLVTLAAISLELAVDRLVGFQGLPDSQLADKPVILLKVEEAWLSSFRLLRSASSLRRQVPLLSELVNFTLQHIHLLVNVLKLVIFHLDFVYDLIEIFDVFRLRLHDLFQLLYSFCIQILILANLVRRLSSLIAMLGLIDLIAQK